MPELVYRLTFSQESLLTPRETEGGDKTSLPTSTGFNPLH